MKRPVKHRKTHCIHGHEFTPENTRIKSNGIRLCRTCERNRDRERGRNKAFRDKRNAAQNLPVNVRKKRLWRYTLTELEVELIIEAQGGVCPCGKPLSDGYFIDHDHACCPDQKSCGRCIRGFLCNSCNVALGFAYNNPDTLNALATYLERYRHRRISA